MTTHFGHGRSRSRNVELSSPGQGPQTPGAPGSPTLTNPDMILPDYEDDEDDDDDDQRELSLNHHDHISTTAWKAAGVSPLDFHLPQQRSLHSAPTQPATPIIYGNGTMLSDIGEVTEVESTIGGRGRRGSSICSESDDDRVKQYANQATVAELIRKKAMIKERQRRPSIDSTSTITTQQDPRAAYGDIDDSVSVDDSNFQGDDEESMATSYVDDNGGGYAHDGAVGATVHLHGQGGLSSNSISKRAEHILANAKRRLTTMEGNLSRARSSLSYSPTLDGSTPSPPMVRPATGLRESSASLSPYHSRNPSENDMHGATRSALQQQRSASALGAAGGYRQPLASSKSAGALDGQSRRGMSKISQLSLDTALEPLDEDDDSASQPGLEQQHFRRSGLPSPSPSMTSLDEEGAGIPRSSSVAQVRGLQEQMNGLKGKISSLRLQAKEDSMKRRSLQSLRTPSPFTHARWDQGYSGPRDSQISKADGVRAPEQVDDEEANEANPEEPSVKSRSSPVESEESEFKDFEEHDNSDSDVSPKNPVNGDGSVGEVPMDTDLEHGKEEVPGLESGAAEYDTQTERSYQRSDNGQSDDTQDDVSESGESVYYDTQQTGISHEDREDAFDYEHFFLHSAMGSLSRRRYDRRGSMDSGSSQNSEDSVETTRGPQRGDARRQSYSTISSMNTFATATEGRSSRSSAFQSALSGVYVEADHEAPANGNAPERWTPSGSGHRHAGSNGTLETRPRTNSVLHRPLRSEGSEMHHHASHRPSISSFDSTGTNRSFPLVNKAKVNGGVLTPSGSPDSELKEVTDRLMDDAAEACGVDESSGGRETPMALKMLSREDQVSLERLMMGVGRCILGLSEGSRAGAEGRMYKRRIEAARRILEGQED